VNVVESFLQGVKIITPARHGDARGFFSESYNRARMAEHGIDTDFVQDNHSMSAQVGTIRGMHFQTPPHAQAKLVRCGQGALLDVVVDIRMGSPTYGNWDSVELSAKNGRQILVPVGFLHGFVTREPNTEIVYKCSDYYAPECDGAVRYDDPELGIEWGVSKTDAVLSVKDQAAPALRAIDNPFRFDPQV